MIEQIRFELLRLAKTRWIYPVVILVALYALLPTMLGRDHGGIGFHVNRTDFQFQLDQADLLAQHQLSDVPQEIRDEWVARLQLTERIVALIDSNHADDPALIAAALEFWNGFMSQADLAANPNEAARLALLNALIDQGADRVSYSFMDEPFLQRASTITSFGLPYPIQIILFVIIISRLFVSDGETDPRTLGNLTPLSPARLVVSRFLGAAIAGFVSIALATAPWLLGALVRNGFGDLTYPVAILDRTIKGDILILPTWVFLLRGLSLLAMTFASLSGVSLFVSRFTNRSGIVLGIVALLAATPMMFAGPDTTMVTGTRPLELATIYLDPVFSLGFPVMSASFHRSPYLNFQWAMIALGAWTVLLVALSAIVIKLRRRL